MEIGAGGGVITRALAHSGAHVIALELDPDLASRLRGSKSMQNVEVVEVDVLRWNWPSETFAVVSNLPFAHSGAILAHLLGNPLVRLRRADLIVQWELAVKQTAVWPATLKSTYWRAWYDLAIARRLARTAFSPSPSVDAAVLHVARRPEPLVPLQHHQGVLAFSDRGVPRQRAARTAWSAPFEDRDQAPRSRPRLRTRRAPARPRCSPVGIPVRSPSGLVAVLHISSAALRTPADLRARLSDAYVKWK